MEVIDLQGHIVKTLVDGHWGVGDHMVTWDGMNNAGQQAPSDLCFPTEGIG